MKYMEEFQSFNKPPVLPEEVNNQEFYRPNPAAFQRKLNENPYVVDVGFSAIDNPVYINKKDVQVMDTRANSKFYNIEGGHFKPNTIDGRPPRPENIKAFTNVSTPTHNLF